MGFTIRSTAFETGGDIPADHTCDGDDRSPALAWSDEPPATKSFVLIVHDPDAPAGDWVHWLLYDVPGERHELPGHVPPQPTVTGLGTQGTNDFRRVGWGGPCPPRGSSHRYRFHLMALDAVLGLPPNLTRDRLLAATRGHVLAETELVGRYRRR